MLAPPNPAADDDAADPDGDDDAKPPGAPPEPPSKQRLRWTPELHERFVRAVEEPR